MTRRAPAAWLRADDTYELRGRSSDPHLDHIVGEWAEKSTSGQFGDGAASQFHRVTGRALSQLRKTNGQYAWQNSKREQARCDAINRRIDLGWRAHRQPRSRSAYDKVSGRRIGNFDDAIEERVKLIR